MQPAFAQLSKPGQRGAMERGKPREVGLRQWQEKGLSDGSGGPFFCHSAHLQRKEVFKSF